MLMALLDMNAISCSKLDTCCVYKHVYNIIVFTCTHVQYITCTCTYMYTVRLAWNLNASRSTLVSQVRSTREGSSVSASTRALERAVTRVIARHARVLVRNSITLCTGRSRNTRSLDDERAREFNTISGVHKRHGSSRIPSKLYA